jgi:hypothetical protein
LKDISGTSLVDSAYSIPSCSSSNTGYFVLIKLNSSGKIQWATFVSNVANNINTNVKKLSIDSNDNIYFVATYVTQNAIAPSIYNANGTSQSLSSYTLPISTGSALTAALLKYNSSGQVQFALFLKGNTSGFSTMSYDIQISSTNDFIWAGGYAASAQIFVQNVNGTGQSNSTIFLPSTGSSQLRSFLIKYNSF